MSLTELPVMLKYVWFVRLRGVSASDLALYSIINALSVESVYVTLTSTFPGKPPSPSELWYENVIDGASLSLLLHFMHQTRFWKPPGLLCRAFSPSLFGRL